MFPWSYLSHVRACRLMLAEDTGGGDGGGPDSGEGDAGGAHTDPPKLDPCPFCAGTDLNDGGEQIVCNTCSAMGPVAGSGMDKHGAWNKRADSAEEAPDPTPADAPPADPAAHAAGIKTLADAKKEIVAIATKAGRVHAGFKQASAALKKATGELETVRVIAKEAVTAKAELVKEKKAHADYKSGEPKRVNLAAQRILASSGHPAVEGELVNPVNGNATNGGAITRAEFDAMTPTARLAHIKAGGKLSA